jgi:hypothetical protein
MRFMVASENWISSKSLVLPLRSILSDGLYLIFRKIAADLTRIVWTYLPTRLRWGAHQVRRWTIYVLKLKSVADPMCNDVPNRTVRHDN